MVTLLVILAIVGAVMLSVLALNMIVNGNLFEMFIGMNMLSNIGDTLGAVIKGITGSGSASE